MAEIFIRQAQLADAPTLAQLAAELGAYATHGEMERQLEILLAEPEHLVLVATGLGESDAPIGWLHARVVMGVAVPTAVEVSALIVKARWRHHGSGGQLIKAAMAWSRQQGVDVFRVCSASDSEQAQRFYTGLGFELVERRHVYEVDLTAMPAD